MIRSDPKVSGIMHFKEIWSIKIFSLGNSVITLGSLIQFFLLVIILYVVSVRLRKFIAHRLLGKYGIELGERQAIATIIQYLFLFIGAVVILQNSGIDLSALGIIAGAVGIGVGFGLQNIANNFLSGLIILFERPVKVGDRIELGNIAGNITRISPRATTMITNDNISVIIPNSEFVNGRVTNWSHHNKMVRFNHLITIPASENPDTIKKILLEVPQKIKNVLDDPEPDVLIDQIDEKGIQYNLRIWSSFHIDTPKQLNSEVYFGILEALKKSGVELNPLKLS